MTTKFCTNCQSQREVEGGVFRKSRTTGRWMCKPCFERKTESIYMNRSGKVADVKTIMSKLYQKAAI
jgi:hypothetical protein